MLEDIHNDKMPPHSPDVEKAVIGALLIEGEAYGRVCDTLAPDSFYERKNQVIYEAVRDLYNIGQSADLLTVTQQLIENGMLATAGGAGYIAEASRFVLSSVNIERHAEILASLAVRRKMLVLASEMEHTAYDESEDLGKFVTQASDEFANIVAGGRQKVSTLFNVLNDIGTIMLKNVEEPGRLNATPTGFPFLDHKGGLQEGNLIIIAGATSAGKTSFANSISLTAIRNDRRVAFYSLEMTKEQLVARLLSRGSKVGSNKILNDPLGTMEQHYVNKERAELMKYGRNMLFDDTSTSNIDKILGSIRALKLRYDIHGVVLDYLQILNVNMRNMNKEQQMGDVARRLKNIAKELKIWVIALSQLHRDNQNPEPTLDRIRDSGQIAEAADIVLLVYRPEVYGKRYSKPFENVDTRGTAQIDVAKGRNVGMGKFICGFDADTTSFYPLSELPTLRVTQTQKEKNKDNDAPF